MDATSTTLATARALLEAHHAEGIGGVIARAAGDPALAAALAPLLAEAADAGNPAGQVGLGMCLALGAGVAKDPAAALARLRAAAEQDDETGLYLYGSELVAQAKDPAGVGEGARWLRRAAERGHAAAQFGLGGLLLDGDTDAPGSTLLEGWSWLQAAADQGLRPAAEAIAKVGADPQAQYFLGLALLKGEEAPPDPAAAVAWLGRAAEQGNVEAWNLLGHAHLTGMGGVPEDPAQAAGWTRRAAERGHPFARLRLAKMLVMGHGLPADEAAAAALLAGLAEAGMAEAMVLLARLHLMGTATPFDPARAEALYRTAAEGGDADAQAGYGEFLLAVREPADVAAARGWLAQAAGQGHAEAAARLAALPA